MGQTCMSLFSPLLLSLIFEICPPPFLFSSKQPPAFPVSQFSYVSCPSLSNANDPCVSFSLIALCPLVSTSHSQRHCRSRLRGVLFVIGSTDLHVPPWHWVNYSLHGNYTCVPRESLRQPGTRKNESITMVVPGDGFHVR